MAILFGLCTVDAAFAQPALRLQAIGGPVSALKEQPGGCSGRDLPDTPARALRTESGMVQLYATDRENRVNTGPDLLHLEHRCAVVFRGNSRDDPAAFDDLAWIATPWTRDGRTIWAIVHNEFHASSARRSVQRAATWIAGTML